MQRLLFTAILVLACSSATIADVRIDEKTQVKFAGAMGKVVNFFGGGATRNGVVRTVAVKGDRKATRSDSTGQIVDLREEKVYDIDFKDKSYDALSGADGLAIVTEWNEFREPDWTKIKKLLKTPVIFDGRNIYNSEQLRGLGFAYYAMGRR